MPNVVPCPKCERDIDAVKAALHRECPECRSTFSDLLTEAENNPDDAGPYYEVRE